jgi:H+/Cl- antiporter ClcA
MYQLVNLLTRPQRQKSLWTMGLAAGVAKWFNMPKTGAVLLIFSLYFRPWVTIENGYSVAFSQSKYSAYD